MRTIIPDQRTQAKPQTGRIAKLMTTYHNPNAFSLIVDRYP